MIAAGTITSTRLGLVLPIHNVPCGQCTYSCLYCGLGGTERLRTRRRPFHATSRVVDAVVRQVARAPTLDHLLFEAGGEPTLDSHIGAEIRRLGTTGIAIAVITNTSLLWREDVRDDLLEADLVSVKLDTVDPGTWRRLNRPGPQLRLSRVLRGVETFARDFGGMLHTETTLVPGVNDSPPRLAELATFLADLRPASAALFLAPGAATPRARTSTATTEASDPVARAHAVLAERLPRVLAPPDESGASACVEGPRTS